MIAASNIETEGNNKKFPPPPPQVLPKIFPQNILLILHRHEFYNGRNKQER